MKLITPDNYLDQQGASPESEPKPGLITPDNYLTRAEPGVESDFTPSPPGQRGVDLGLVRPGVPRVQKSNQGRISSAGGSFMRGFGSIVASLPKAIGEGAVAIANKFGDDPLWGNPEGLTPEDTTAYKAGNTIERWFSKFAVNPEYRDEFWASKIPEGAGFMAGFASGGIAGRAAGIPALVSTMGLGATATGVEGVQDYLGTLSMDEKANPEIRQNAFLLNGALGTSEGLPISMLLDRLDTVTGGGVKKIIMEGFKGGLEELTQEVLQTVGQNAIASKILEYDKNRDLFSGAVDAGEVGFTLGFMMNTMAAMIGARRTGRVSQAEPAEVEQAETEETEPVDILKISGVEVDSIDVGDMTKPGYEATSFALGVQREVQEDRAAQEDRAYKNDIAYQRADADQEAEKPTAEQVIYDKATQEEDPRYLKAKVRRTAKNILPGLDEQLSQAEAARPEMYSPDRAPANSAMADALGMGGVSRTSFKYFDQRLRRQNYRDELESMANSLTAGGDVQLVPDPNFIPGESDVRGESPLVRTPSINPDWFQGMNQSPDLKMSVKEIGNAVKKAVAGERLGVRQARVVGAMLDQYQGERTSYENLEYARNQLDVARKARNSAGMPESQDWLFEENEYPADADGLTRTFMELHDQARQRSGEVLERVEALLERQQSDEEILNAITAVLKGEQDGRQSTIGTEIDAQPPTEIQDTGQEPIAGEPAPGGLGEGSGIAPVDRPVETELDFQLAEQTESGLEEKEARAQNQTIAAKEQADRELLGFQLQGQVVEEPSVQMPLVEPVAQPVKKHPGKKLEAAKEEAGRRKRKTTGIAKERRSADKRRQDWAYRKEIDSMGTQEKEAVIKQLRHDAMVNKLSGLGSRMAWEGVEKKKNIASIDADSLKYVNDKLGNKAGDQLLVEIGKALGKEFGVDAYHVSGDEYWVHGDSRDDLVAGLEDVQKSLDEKTVVGPGGSMKGLGFSYGVSEDESQADRDMKTNKQTRTEAGDRVERGERPAGVKLKGDKQAIIKKKVLPKLKYARKKFAYKESQNAYNKLVDRRKKLAKLLDCINR